jgi:DNA-binding response OmpR family regulator
LDVHAVQFSSPLSPVIGRPRLLIAEDDFQIMFPLREFFSERGFDVDCVVGPIEGGRMLERFPYSVMLTDLHLTADRRAEGMQLLQQARKHQPAIRAIMMTAFPSSQVEYDARRMGADAVLAKPLGLRALNDVICGLDSLDE